MGGELGATRVALDEAVAPRDESDPLVERAVEFAQPQSPATPTTAATNAGTTRADLSTTLIRFSFPSYVSA
jgi:hypothetical protein